MSFPIKHLSLALAIAVGLPSCGLFRKKKAAVGKPADVVMIGAVDLVNEDQHFVLVHNPSRFALPTDTELVASNASGETARLKLTPERKGSFLTADIVSGQPAKGDTVLWRRVQAPAPVAGSGAEPTARITIPNASPVPTSPQESSPTGLPTGSASPGLPPP